MNSKQISPNRPGFDAESELSNFTADILTYRDEFMMRLFACPAGHWFYVDELAEGDETLIEQIDTLEDAADVDLMVMWVDYSEIMDQDGFVSVVFYADGHGWSSVGLYNKGLLDAKQAADTGH